MTVSYRKVLLPWKCSVFHLLSLLPFPLLLVPGTTDILTASRLHLRVSGRSAGRCPGLRWRVSGRWAGRSRAAPLVSIRQMSGQVSRPHSSTLAWKIPWTEEPGGLQSMGSLRVGYAWATSLSLFTLMHWRRKWQPTPVFLPGESQGPGSLVGCHLWGRTESDTTEAT